MANTCKYKHLQHAEQNNCCE